VLPASAPGETNNPLGSDDIGFIAGNSLNRLQTGEAPERRENE
jgi:hypothetical protein